MKRTQSILVLFFVLFALARCKESSKFYGNTMRSDVFYQTYSENKYDFLWVFDNSGSMLDRRNYVKDNLQNFLNILNSRKAIDYQMALTTTDYFTHAGNLVQSPTGLKVVKSATSANPVSDFASIINNVQDTVTSFWEQGLESSYAAMLNHGSEFSRNGVPLVVVYLTDEEDYSCKENCFGVEPENNANYVRWDLSRYTTYFQNVKAAENSEVAIFPIVGLNTTNCTIASAGSRYMGLSDAIGNFGTSGSICNSDLKNSYEGIARKIADRSAKFTLANKASGTGINVYVDGVLIPYSPENYIFEDATNSIIFTGVAPKKGAIIEVTYNQQGA